MTSNAQAPFYGDPPGTIGLGGSITKSSEIRVVNEKTGGEKGSKDERYDLIPYSELAEVARLYGKGAKKYAPHNWAKGYDWSLSFASMMRHATMFWEGQSYDEETGCHHLSSVVFHALALMRFEKDFPDLDDRPPARLDDTRTHDG